MNRRRLLRSTGALATAGLAGCLGGGSGSPTDTPTDGPDDPATSFSVSATRCGSQANRAAVTFGEGVVTVDGTLWGNDACYTGRLGSVSIDGDTLTVRVTAERPDDVRGCAQCISEIDYRATVEVASPPSTVVVVHRGETVTTASH